MRLAIEESRKILVKYRKIRPFWVLLLLPMVASLSACKADKAADEEVVRPVKVAILAPASSGRVLTYSGVVRARVESAVGFRVSGKIVERRVNVGDRLEVGQVIARLDETDLKLAEGSAKPLSPRPAAAATSRVTISSAPSRCCPKGSSRRPPTTSGGTKWMRPPRRSRPPKRNCARP